jgi:hypothetical protein|tara:strand:+ start:5702 stop:6742 length:1041 start_codon:yes stop_codon:yes gene_type:complete
MSKALTNLEDFLGTYKGGNNDSLENRPDLYPYLSLALKYAKSGQVLPADVLQEYIDKGWDDSRNINYPLIDDLVTTINAAKLTTCEASATAIDTAVGTITSVNYNFEFTMKLADSYTNAVGYAEEFKTKYESGARGLSQVLNTYVNTQVEAVANTYFPPALQAAYWPDNVAADAFLIPETGIPRIYNNLQGVMREMNMDTVTSNWDVMCTTPHFTEVVDLLNQGSGNDTNTGYQFGPFNFQMEKDLAIGEATSGQAAMVIVPNTFGLFNTNQPDAKNFTKTSDGKEWALVNDPMTGLPLSAIFSSKCDTAESIESYQYQGKFSFVSKYNSDTATRYSPWLKLEIEA